jgi:hypothetical protein
MKQIMQKLLVLISVFIVLPVPLLSQSSRYCAETVMKVVNGKSTIEVDHSLIIIYAHESKAEIQTKSGIKRYYFYGLPEKQTLPDGEEIGVFPAKDQDGKECKFIMGGIEQPIFRIWYDKNNRITYTANIIL